MIDNFEYTYLPKGKVILCSCDQVYFEFFFDKLYTSFTKNISEFNQLHIHLINPDINLINSIKKGNTKSNVSFSWEGEAQISLIKKLKININDWEKILPIKIKNQLLAESLKRSAIRSIFISPSTVPGYSMEVFNIKKLY